MTGDTVFTADLACGFCNDRCNCLNQIYQGSSNLKTQPLEQGQSLFSGDERINPVPPLSKFNRKSFKYTGNGVVQRFLKS